LFWFSKATDKKIRIRIQVRIRNPRIRIRIKMSRIRNTSKYTHVAVDWCFYFEGYCHEILFCVVFSVKDLHSCQCGSGSCSLLQCPRLCHRIKSKISFLIFFLYNFKFSFFNFISFQIYKTCLKSYGRNQNQSKICYFFASFIASGSGSVLPLRSRF
jgi:hypothetical protein